MLATAQDLRSSVVGPEDARALLADSITCSEMVEAEAPAARAIKKRSSLGRSGRTRLKIGFIAEVTSAMVIADVKSPNAR
ncbi:MAG: hypothetical protein HC923_13710 [Myxococcales bacterium]|nr:hypothetical protein [Myxococcales bacterium]